MIQINNITKCYGHNRGVFNISFQIDKGEVFGFLGPNGAGKTTTIRQLLGFINSDEGYCTINGLNCRTQSSETMSFLGYLPAEISFFDGYNGKQFIELMANLRNLNSLDHAKYLIDYFELDTNVSISKMSKGMKQKLAIVSAFMHKPTVLILDEPTSGLDPLMQKKFNDLILSEKKLGTTILMSSHSFEEVERTCDRVGIIKQGKLVALESVKNVNIGKEKHFSATFISKEEASRFAENNPYVTSENNDNVTFAISGELKPLFSMLANYQIIDLKSISISLEEVFMHYYK